MRYVSIDVEYTNESKLYSPFSEDRLLTVAAYDGKRTYFWNFNHPNAPTIFEEGYQYDTLDTLYELLQDENITLIAHNLKSDMLWLEKFWESFNVLDYRPIKCKPFCTMVAADTLQLINRSVGEKNNLETLVLKYTKHEPWKGKINVKKLIHEPFEKVKEYNIADAVDAFDLGMYILKLFKQKKYAKEAKLFAFDMENLKVLLKMELTGVLVDKYNLLKAGRVTYHNVIKFQKKLDKLIGHPVYIQSNKELPKVLYEELKMPVLMETPTGQPATDVPAIDELLWYIKENKLENNWKEILLTLKEFRKEEKLWNTFISVIPEYIKIDGRIHAKFNLGKGYGADPKHEFGAGTGRLSSSDPNLQNQANKNLIRNIIVAGENNTLLEADYSQVELCVAAFLAKEKNMIKALLEGKDLHSFTLANLENISYEECIHILNTPTHAYYLVYKNKRWMIKRVGFGILYGIGVDKLRRVFRLIDVDYSFGQTKAFIEQWFDFFPDIRTYIKDTQDEANKYGFVTTPTGRKIMTPFAKEGIDHALIARNHRQAVNGKIQSFAADICKIAMLLVSKKFPEILRTQVHDSLLMEKPRKDRFGNLVDIRPEIKKIMTTDTKKFLKDIFNVDFNVPLKVDFKEGREWRAA